MATAARTKENGYDFPLFKTPLRTPSEFRRQLLARKSPTLVSVRTGMLSSATLNDLASYSNGTNKHLKFVNATSMNDLQMCQDAITTPIRLNKMKFATPSSTQRRRALGLVNHNSHQINHPISCDDLSAKNVLHEKSDEPVVLAAPPVTCAAHPEDDLPYQPNPTHSYADTFDDLIPGDERIERFVRNFDGGVNIFAYYGGMENTIRCQSPIASRLNVSTLLDMVDILN